MFHDQIWTKTFLLTWKDFLGLFENLEVCGVHRQSVWHVSSKYMACASKTYAAYFQTGLNRGVSRTSWTSWTGLPAHKTREARDLQWTGQMAQNMCRQNSLKDLNFPVVRGLKFLEPETHLELPPPCVLAGVFAGLAKSWNFSSTSCGPGPDTS